MRIAIVGTGIAGLTVAHLLAGQHDLVLYDANDHIGGHTHTHDIENHGDRQSIDTGFIVFNDWTYPNFITLLNKLGVESKPTTMSFSVKDERDGTEYNGTSLNSLFAQRSNLLNPGFLRMIYDIVRFNRQALRVLEPGRNADMTLGAFLDAGGYSRRFVEHYIIPMGSAIWSADPVGFRNVPMRFFVQFFKNHGMLNITNRPVWRVISGGSKQYIEPLVRPFRHRIRLRTPVEYVTRHPNHVEIKARGLDPERFDAVVMAAHSDQSLHMLADPSPAEREILGAIPFQRNHTILHTDASVLPRRRLAWAAWNYHVLRERRDCAALTYNMNILQRLQSPHTYCVTLNRPEVIDDRKLLRRLEYEHPVFNVGSVAAQQRHHEINGKNRTYYCGAYWRYGFHEDGVVSGLRVASLFGQEL